jgi:hypothetical protein
MPIAAEPARLGAYTANVKRLWVWAQVFQPEALARQPM